MKVTGINAVLAFAVCFGGCTFNVREESRDIILSNSSAGLNEIVVEEDLCAGNDVSLTGVADTNVTLMVSARCLSADRDEDILGMLRCSLGADGRIGYAYSGDGWSRIKIDRFEIEADSALDCDISTLSGDVTVQDMRGFCTLESASGDCECETAEGCSIETVSGDVKLNLVSDTALDTAVVYVKTESGDVTVYFPPDSAGIVKTIFPVRLKTVSGDVVLFVPEGFTADLDFTTTNGDDDISERFIDNAAATNRITCRTTSGDLTIRTYP
jgi:hypothetical protein